ncbi:hypothetical protein ACFWIQ_07115 [Kitasatospora sp. NPDC127059]|uniref:hypothetical protein n=1 Tax=unclassified Kitasatospora TaxID=2633591 RepID=UPI00365C558B
MTCRARPPGTGSTGGAAARHADRAVFEGLGVEAAARRGGAGEQLDQLAHGLPSGPR